MTVTHGFSEDNNIIIYLSALYNFLNTQKVLYETFSLNLDYCSLVFFSPFHQTKYACYI